MNIPVLMRILAEKGLTAQQIADVVETIQTLNAPPRAKKSTARFVPETWEPKEAHHLKAAELGISDQQFTGLLTSFREWEFKAGKSNFDLAFHRWLRTSRERPNGTGIVDYAADRHEQRTRAVIAGATEAARGGGRQRWRL